MEDESHCRLLPLAHHPLTPQQCVWGGFKGRILCRHVMLISFLKIDLIYLKQLTMLHVYGGNTWSDPDVSMVNGGHRI